MKRIKELLWLIIPLILLGVLPILYVILWMDTGFVSGSQYLRLLLEDEIFYRALLATYGKPLLFSILAVAAFALVRHLLKRKMTMSPQVYRLCSVAIGVVVALAGTVLFRTIDYVPLPMPYFQSHMPAVTLADIIVCLQIGLLAALVICPVEWIVERAEKRVKKHT